MSSFGSPEPTSTETPSNALTMWWITSSASEGHILNSTRGRNDRAARSSRGRPTGLPVDVPRRGAASRQRRHGFDEWGGVQGRRAAVVLRLASGAGWLVAER